MSPIATAILAFIQAAPTLWNEGFTLYNAVKNDLSATDQDAVEAALESAQTSDAAATAAADQALDTASKT